MACFTSRKVLRDSLIALKSFSSHVMPPKTKIEASYYYNACVRAKGCIKWTLGMRVGKLYALVQRTDIIQPPKEN